MVVKVFLGFFSIYCLIKVTCLLVTARHLMLSAVIGMGATAVCLSVCPSVRHVVVKFQHKPTITRRFRKSKHSSFRQCIKDVAEIRMVPPQRNNFLQVPHPTSFSSTLLGLLE